MYKYILLLLILFLTACASPKPLVLTEYVTVEVPVMYKLERPERPQQMDLSIPEYIQKLLYYIKELEFIIDEVNND